jgi:hypothetical protein
MSFVLNLWIFVIAASGFYGSNYCIYKGRKYAKEQKIRYSELFIDTVSGFYTGITLSVFFPLAIIFDIIITGEIIKYFSTAF